MFHFRSSINHIKPRKYLMEILHHSNINSEISDRSKSGQKWRTVAMLLPGSHFPIMIEFKSASVSLLEKDYFQFLSSYLKSAYLLFGSLETCIC